MPRGDRTGPEGFGSMTGRQMGYCVGNDRPGFENSSRGFGRGRGSGRGFGGGMGNHFGYGRGNRYYSEGAIPNVSEKTLLENEVKILKEQLNSMEKQLSNLSKKD
jgi:hypothetical protein